MDEVSKLKERIKKQVKGLSRAELEKKYLVLLFKTSKSNASLTGVLGSMISIKNKHSVTKECKDIETISERKKQYYKDLEHPLWFKKRQIILERDNHKCKLCGKKTNLCIHHIKYRNGKRPWEYPNSALVTLCNECHTKVHQDKNHKLYPQFFNE